MGASCSKTGTAGCRLRFLFPLGMACREVKEPANEVVGDDGGSEPEP